MKILFTLVFALTSLAASAEVFKLTEYVDNGDKDVYRTDFRVNKSLARAWPIVTISESWGDDLHYSDVEVLIPGLAYSPELNGVVFNTETEQIVCGTFYNRRWTIDLGMSFKATGRCKFSTKRSVKTVDDGFRINKYKMVEVLLTIE